MPHPLRPSSTHAFKHVLQEIDDSGLRVLAIASAKPGPKGLKAASIKRSVGCRRVPSKQKFAWLLQELPEMRALVSINHSQAFSSGHTSSQDHMQAHMKGRSCSRQKDASVSAMLVTVVVCRPHVLGSGMCSVFRATYPRFMR